MTDAAPGTGLVLVDRARGTSAYNPMIFGHFVEHFDTQVYGGLFWPGSPLSDARGFRMDVVEALKEIGSPIMRWPGGDFVSDYHRQDAVGPQRTPTFNLAWQVPEPNAFGTDEFIAWCREVGCEPYICTNAGTGTAQEMSDWVEYCNGTLPTRNAERRRANGHPEPYGVRYWGIGNESYGEWQIGAKSANEWGRYVAEAAKMMRRVDPSIVLSAAAVPDPEWTLSLLKAAGRHLDLVSIHEYWDPLWQEDRPKGYREVIQQCGKPGRVIEATRQILGVAGVLERIGIAFDEWNLRGWHHPAGNSPEALAARRRNDAAETYTMADAVFSAGFLNNCLRNADLVRMANISPSVNTRGPLLVHEGGLVRRSTFHVLEMYGTLLLPRRCDAFVRSHGIGDVPAVDAVATADGEAGPLSLRLINRDPEEHVEVTLRIDGTLPDGIFAAEVLAGDSPDAFNSVGHPKRVVPQPTRLGIAGGRLRLPPHSVVRLTAPPPDSPQHKERQAAMSAPIYRDPVEDGAADPTVIQRRGTREWWMFYTNRRPDAPGPHFTWLHGSRIGVAVSTDDGASWRHRGEVEGLNDPADPGRNTHWAPEVVWAGGRYHMFLSYTRGVPDGLTGVDRRIVQFTSPDLEAWSRVGPLELSSRNVIDACVLPCPDGLWRLWYKDEAQGSSTWSATSRNLLDWHLEGQVLPGAPDHPPHEGPNVFALGDWFWLIVDEWRGQAVYRSPDALGWTRQGLIGDRPGAHPLDRRFVRHADVVVTGDSAAMYYFTHPAWDEANQPDGPPDAESRRTAIHHARLIVKGDSLLFDRDVEPGRPLLVGGRS